MRKKPTVWTILMGVALIACCVGIWRMAPQTLDSYNDLRREQKATPTPTADIGSVLKVTIDPNNTPTPTVLMLTRGSAGDEVTRLQTRLKELGYYTGEVDGQFGDATVTAVKLFQSQHGLISDGKAGTDTLSAVYSAAADYYIPTPSPSPTPEKLSKGDNGDAVKSLQTRLKTLGYYKGSVDGDYGGGTQEAIRLFQEQNGLSVDGVCGAQTMALVFSDSAREVTVTPTPDPAKLPILVNKEHPVGSDYYPGDLVVLKSTLPSDLVTVKGSDIEGNREAVAALEEMFTAAKAEGVTGWQISAGYRSYAYQQKLFDNQVAEYVAQGMTKAKATGATSQTVANPGESEHHTGLAFDITVAGTTFKGTEQQIWLHKHCWDYGFVVRYQEDKEKITGFIAEAWHIRYVGVKHATAMRDGNLCLEEYLQQLGA